MGEEYRARSLLPPARGSLRRVVSITSHFQSESPLHPGAKLALPSVFEQSWPDPAKLGDDSRSASILLHEATETLAGHLGVRPAELGFLGDHSSGFHIALSGLLTPESRLIHSAIDRQDLFAVAAHHQARGGVNEILEVDLDGHISWPSEIASASPTINEPSNRGRQVIAWQLMNGETGGINPAPQTDSVPIFYDATASGVRIPLPSNWSTALWDSRSWGGPSGLTVFARREGSAWRNPLPHLNNRLTPEGVSPALIILSALSIDSWVADEKSQALKIAQANARIRGYITEEIGDVDIASPADASDHLLSFSFLFVDAEKLVHDLAARGVAVDSGSACNSTNLEPSHVLAAMGRLTQGNIRLTLKHNLLPEDVDLLLLALKECVNAQRS